MEITAEQLLVQMLRDGIGRRAEAPESERNHKVGGKARYVYGKNLGYLRRRTMNKQVFFWEFFDSLTREMLWASDDTMPRYSDHPVIKQLLADNLVSLLAASHKFPNGGVALTPTGHEYAKKLLTLEKL